MEKKSRAFILPAAAVVAALVSIAARVILTLTELDVKYGVYKRGSVLSTVYHIILALVCLAFIAVPLVKRKKLGVPESPKVGDIAVNPCKKKHLTAVRSSGADEALILVTPVVFSLEEAIEFITDDELIEVTPKSIRLRKRILNTELRLKAQSKKNKN